MFQQLNRQDFTLASPVRLDVVVQDRIYSCPSDGHHCDQPFPARFTTIIRAASDLDQATPLVIGAVALHRVAQACPSLVLGLGRDRPQISRTYCN